MPKYAKPAPGFFLNFCYFYEQKSTEANVVTTQRKEDQGGMNVAMIHCARISLIYCDDLFI